MGLHCPREGPQKRATGSTRKRAPMHWTRVADFTLSAQSLLSVLFCWSTITCWALAFLSQSLQVFVKTLLRSQLSLHILDLAKSLSLKNRQFPSREHRNMASEEPQTPPNPPRVRVNTKQSSPHTPDQQALGGDAKPKYPCTPAVDKRRQATIAVQSPTDNIFSPISAKLLGRKRKE